MKISKRVKIGFGIAVAAVLAIVLGKGQEINKDNRPEAPVKAALEKKKQKKLTKAERDERKASQREKNFSKREARLRRKAEGRRSRAAHSDWKRRNS